MAMALAASVFVLLLAASTVYGVNHIVGGSAGWGLTAGSYSSWAATQTFTVGDNLVFIYDPSHGVDVVNEEDYNSCTSSNPINSFKGGRTIINLTSPGRLFIVCPTEGHCSAGMKLAITVVAAGGDPSTFPATPPPLVCGLGDTPVTGITVQPPPLMYFSGALNRSGSITYLMVSLFVSGIIFACTWVHPLFP